MKKSLLSTVLGAFVLAFAITAAPVMAAEVDVTAENDTTGADSVNHNISTVDHDGDKSLENNGDVDNEANAHLNTGSNDQSMNTTGGDLDTGMIDASTDWESVVNEGFGLCGCPFGDGDDSFSANFTNEITGKNSHNLNHLHVDNGGDVSVTNIADILNDIYLSANTGHNDQNMNTTAGDLETGDVGLMAGIINVANVADGNGDSGSGTDVDVMAENSTTGADSQNNNIVTVLNDGEKNLSNKATVNNDITVRANTGHNEQNMNTTAGDLTTGGVDVSTEIENVANVGGVCCPGGDDSVSADLTNDTTGSNSTNHNAVTVNKSGDTNVSNDATIDNNLNVTADTGNSHQNGNTEGGDVETGEISVHFGSSTTANSSN